MTSLTHGPAQALALSGRASEGARPYLEIADEDVWNAFGGTWVRVFDPRHPDFAQDTAGLSGALDLSPTFDVDSRLYSFDWHYLRDWIEDLGQSAQQKFPDWLWLGFLLEQALGQSRPWDPAWALLVRKMSVPWSAIGPRYLSGLNDEGAIDRWVADIARLRDAGLLS